MRHFVIEDPRFFLSNLPDGAILDEIQRTPELFSYLEEILDNSKEKAFTYLQDLVIFTSGKYFPNIGR